MTIDIAKSPSITHISWGKMKIENIGYGKDFKLWPGGGRSWNWKETGTHHVPGIQPSDTEEILAHGATHIILTRGMLLALQTSKETLEFLQNNNINFRIEETRKAVEIYNELSSSGVPVGGLFHSTC